MAKHLINAGYQLNVYNRTQAKAQSLIDQGATWHNSPGEAAANAAIIITIVGFPQDVDSTYFDSNGILAHAKTGSLLIDMTTSSPALAKRIYNAAKEKQIASLDAPVSGGDKGAREGTLSIMVGGDVSAFDRAQPIFAAMGKNIVHQGKTGSGQHTKICNQIAVAACMIGLSESLAYAKQSGLDPSTVLKSISSGAAGSWSLSNLGPRVIQGDFAPGFYVKHFIKDLGIALDSAETLCLDIPGTQLAKKLYTQLANQGDEDLGTQALFKLFID